MVKKTQLKQKEIAERLAKLPPQRRTALLQLLKKQGINPLHLPILPTERNTHIFPLSWPQQRLWFIDQFEGTSATYNAQLPLRIKGPLNITALQKTLNAIVKRHEILRTTFETVEGRPMQHIHDQGHWPLHVEDWQSAAGESDDILESRIQDYARQQSETSFEVSALPLVRASLIQLPSHQSALLLDIHHIIWDAWSVDVFAQEFSQLYPAYSQDKLPTLEPLSIQYADFALWQRQWLQGDIIESQLSYWKQQLSNVPALLELPTNHPRPPIQRFKGATHKVALPPSLVEHVKILAKQHRVTMFMALLTAFKILLYRYSGQQDITVGTPITNRQRVELKPLIGFFLNTLALRSQIQPTDSVSDLLEQVRRNALDAYAHQDLPFEKVVEEISPERTLAHTPLVQVMFIFQNVPADPLEFDDITLTLVKTETVTAKFDLTLSMEETEKGLIGYWEYNNDLFEAETISRMAAHFEVLLESMVADVQQPVATLPILSANERQKLLVDWNSTAADYPLTQCLHELFEHQVEKTPEATAVAFEEICLTYAELNQRANQLAHYLQALGVKPEALVGIYIERSLDLVVGLLGILKAGGAYVPMDPSYPQARLEYMVEDANISLLLTQSKLATTLSAPQVQMISIDTDWAEIASLSSENPSISVLPENLAYVIYTSGSTGQPKGVAIPHRGLVNYLSWCIEAYDVVAGSGTLVHSSIGFDATITGLFAPLLVGNPLVLVSSEQEIDGLSQALEGHQNLSLVKLTPAHLELLSHTLSPATLAGQSRALVIGGEALHGHHIDFWRTHAPATRLINEYGPTETVVGCCVYEVTADEEMTGPVPIGRPIANTQLYVLDTQQQPAAVGIVGELYIGGAGVARGYLNRPELTAARFIANPFGKGRLYRTGDLARYRDDGCLEYCGRIDTQVKIRGFRIEPGEIEAVLNGHPQIDQSTVMMIKDSPDNTFLVAYAIPQINLLSDGADTETDKWQTEQVDTWLGMWQSMYSETAVDADPTFNLAGWNSSYTGHPIPDWEMKEWVNNTVTRILACQPQKLLEIGCGTGLLLSRVAPHCRTYWATDYSSSVLKQVDHLVKARSDLSNVTLTLCRANDFDKIPTASFDTVVLNSVVQYFPSLNYLLVVIEGALSALGERGNLFIGDVRSLPLLESYHAAVQFARMPETASIKQWQQQVQQSIAIEEELVIDPHFFLSLQKRYPTISGVDIQLKRGQAQNELTQFRYDVILRVGQTNDTVSVPWHHWPSKGWTVAKLRQYLLTEQPISCGLREVPNKRLQSAGLLQEWLRYPPKEQTISALDQEVKLRLQESAGVDLEYLWAIAAESGYTLYSSWHQGYANGAYDVAFVQTQSQISAPIQFGGANQSVLKSRRTFSNNPMRGKLTQYLVPKLRQCLQERLPEYMVPPFFVLLDKFPLTPNGKIDRKALPTPIRNHRRSEDFTAPQTEQEILLAELFSNLLGLPIEQVGIHDNFFELGGHSLLAAQLVARLRQSLGIELSLRQLFEGPTIAEMSSVLINSADQSSNVPAITRFDRNESSIPLSYAQERLWFLAQLEGPSSAYNMSGAVQIEGKFDVSILQWSIGQLISRHEVLRTTFPVVDGTAVQHIAPNLSIPLNISKISELDASITDFLAQEAMEPFDLEAGPLLRITLLYGQENTAILAVTMHHIISDGWSISLFIKELIELYESYHPEQPVELPPLLVQYADYSLWQRQWLQGDILQQQLAYWQQQLAGAPALLELPTDRPRPAVQRFVGDTFHMQLPLELNQRISAFSKRQKVTPFMTLLAAYQLLLHRYSGQSDVAVGTPIANRQRPELEQLIGCFVNTLVLRIQIAQAVTVSDFLQQVRAMCLDAYSHQDVPFEQVVDALQPSRTLAHTPLFQVTFVLQNMPVASLSMDEATLKPVNSAQQTAQFDLTLLLQESEAGLEAYWNYNSDLFDAQTIERMAGQYKRLLSAFIEDEAQLIDHLPLLSTDERQMLLQTWNQTAADYSLELCIHEQFERQVERTPTATAVSLESETLTYRELNTRANQLAQHLQTLGVKAGALVGICLERSLDMVIGLLGILKAGGAYVPLEPSYPSARLQLMVEDAQVSIILTKTHLLDIFPESNAQLVCLDKDWPTIAKAPVENPSLDIMADDLAYVIFTSGSTGHPKGVMVPHRAISNHMQWIQHTFPLDEADKFLQRTNFSFDASVWEFYAPLLAGAQLVLAPPDRHQDGEDLIKVILEQKITNLQLVPALLRILLSQENFSQCQSLKRVFCGGEALPADLQQEFYSQLEAPLFNLYGPTEACINSTYWSCQADEGSTTIPIGQPIANVQAYVLDSKLRLTPIGVPGELYLGGAGIARGYLNRPELTAEKFIPNPFGSGLLYKTGDLVRYRSSGAIEHLGRIDHQVKLRGFRIELGEIETVLNSYPQVKQCVVILRQDMADHQRIVAYGVGEDLSIATLKDYLKQRLPDYMVPSTVVLLDALPLTPNGKVDRNALPAPSGEPDRSRCEFVAPETELEKTLAEIWQSILGLEHIGIHDNFFELGGDSILSIQIIAQARKAGLAFNPKQLFQNQTIAELAINIEQNTATTILAQQGVVTGVVPLSPIQKWFLDQSWSNPHHFNQALLLQVPADLKIDELRQSLHHLAMHHDALRLRFVQEEGQWQQFHREPDDDLLPLEVVDLSHLPMTERLQALTELANQRQARLNFSEGPIGQVVLFQLDQQQPHRLLLILHHLIVDGVSWRILLGDLLALYHQALASHPLQLSPKTTAFQDWVLKLQGYSQLPEFQDSLKYWLQLPWSEVSPLPVDMAMPSTETSSVNMKSVSVSLSAAETEELLKQVPEAYNTQINDALLTALVLSIGSWSKRSTVLIHLEGHGREHLFDEVDVSLTVGWFTSLYPVLLTAANDISIGTALKAVKEQLREVPQAGMSYGLLRYMTQNSEIESALSALPTPEVIFNYFGQIEQGSEVAAAGWSLAREPIGATHSPQGQPAHQLDINAQVVSGRLEVIWAYDSIRYRSETIENLAQDYIRALQALIDHCLSPESGGYTPSDFPSASMTQSELDDIVEQLSL
ncbi:MAG: amino acid adenylation domain-containing protein [Cyanobacteria bacterium P01_H01_bin.21]